MVYGDGVRLCRNARRRPISPLREKMIFARPIINSAGWFAADNVPAAKIMCVSLLSGGFKPVRSEVRAGLMPCADGGFLLEPVHFISQLELAPFQLCNLERVFGRMDLAAIEFFFQQLVTTLQLGEMTFDGHSITSR